MRRRSTRINVAGALASAAAVIGALGSGVAFGPAVQAGSSTSGVAFSSTPGVATLLAHYEVTHGASPAGPQAAAPAAPQSSGAQDLPEHSPKTATNTPAAGTSAGVKSDNTIARSSASGNGGTPRPSKSFIGQQGSKTTCSYFAQGCNPPDMALAASPDFVLQGVNTQFEVWDSKGQVQPGWPMSAQNFFGVPNVTMPDGTPCDAAHHSQPSLSDPRALYDAATGRFWAAMLQYENALGVPLDCPFKSVYLIAVSQTNDPRGAWNVYEFNMSLTPGFAADYTQIAVNRDAVFFSANMFGDPSGFYAEIFEANKAQMEAGQGGFTADGFYNLQGNGPGITPTTGPFLADTVQPVQNLDHGGTHDGLFVDTVDGPDLLNGHLCQNAADACQGLILWRMKHPIAHDKGGSAPILTGTLLHDVKPSVFPPAATQPSCAACVDGNDLRIGATPVLKDGTIHTAWGTAIDNGTNIVPAIEWAEVRPGDVEDGEPVTRSGYFNFSGDAAAAYPVVMPRPGGGVLMLYEHMSSTVFPEIRIALRSDDGQFHSAGRVLKAGEASYRPFRCGTAIPVCRWGDYEAASWDGQGRVWVAGEYANTHTDPVVAPWFGRNWGTWIGAISSDSEGSN